MDQDNAMIVEELNRLNNMRRLAAGVAVALLIASLFVPSMGLAVLRSIAWAAAGVMALLHTQKARQAGLQASYTSAIIYFVVCVMPLLKGR
jgi:membrane-bound ClpP family serine protease